MKRSDAAAGRFVPDVATEERILAAAHTVFMRRGTAGARMQEIADEAGVNKALLHYYFRSKDRLADAVFRHAAVQLFPPVIEILGGDLPIEDKVARVVEKELTFLAQNSYLAGYLISELNHEPERIRQLITAITGGPPERIRPRVLNTIRRQIDERVRARAMRPITAEQFVINLLALCVFPFATRPLVTLILGDDKAFLRFIEQRRRELTSFFLNALRP